jgi:hypothetical protein
MCGITWLDLSMRQNVVKEQSKTHVTFSPSAVEGALGSQSTSPWIVVETCSTQVNGTNENYDHIYCFCTRIAGFKIVQFLDRNYCLGDDRIFDGVDELLSE